MYIFGGCDGKTVLKDVWIFDKKKPSWEFVEYTGQVVPLFRHTAVRIKDCMYVVGGVSSD